MNILVACEESQVVCSAFRKLGHNAFSCDISNCSGNRPDWHIMQDVISILNPFFYESDLFYGIRFFTTDGKPHSIPGRWDLIIAHPPCTYMSKAGARWMYPKSGQLSEERLKLGLAAKDFFLKILSADCLKIAIENPVPLKVIGLPPPTQIIQPYQFGEPYSKKTLLWLKGLPNLTPTNIITNYTPYLPSNTSLHSKGFGGSCGIAHNSKTRSRTFSGIAVAMAEQWG